MMDLVRQYTGGTTVINGRPYPIYRTLGSILLEDVMPMGANGEFGKLLNKDNNILLFVRTVPAPQTEQGYVYRFGFQIPGSDRWIPVEGDYTPTPESMARAEKTIYDLWPEIYILAWEKWTKKQKKEE